MPHQSGQGSIPESCSSMPSINAFLVVYLLPHLPYQLASADYLPSPLLFMINLFKQALHESFKLHISIVRRINISNPVYSLLPQFLSRSPKITQNKIAKALYDVLFYASSSCDNSVYFLILSKISKNIPQS